MSTKEIHNAIVVRNTDDDEGLKLRGAVFFNAPTLFSGEFPEPAFPCFPFASSNGAGMFYVPKVDDEIEIEIEVDDGTDDTTDIELPEPRYRCMIYSDEADIDAIFKVNYPFRMGWKSNSGHYLLFDDSKGNELVKLFHTIGTFIEMDKDGNYIENVIKDKTSTVGGNITEIVEGDITKLIAGDLTQQLVGDELKTTIGEVSWSVVKEFSIDSMLNMTLESMLNIFMKALILIEIDAPIVKIGKSPQVYHATLSENVIALYDIHQHPPIPPLIGGPVLPPLVTMSSLAGTPLDPTALRIFLGGNL